MPQSFTESFNQIAMLAQREQFKPMSAMNSKLMEEVGELSVAVLVEEGHITHKTLSEPLVGEVADVVQNAIAILVKATPDMLDEHRMELFLSFLEAKNNKWDAVQKAEDAAMKIADGSDEIDSAYDGIQSTPATEPMQEYYDPARAYTEATGRYLSLEERMNERRLHDLHQHKPEIF